jgi:hypothetical protein
MPRIVDAPHGLGPETTIRRLHREDLHGLGHVIPPHWGLQPGPALAADGADGADEDPFPF